VNIIRRGDFKKLDQELETGWKRGMFNFEKSISLRREEGFQSSSAPLAASFSWSDVEDYIEQQPEISR
jgi:twitching motility protein PilT